MALEISRITVEVRDRRSGQILHRELMPGQPWPESKAEVIEATSEGAAVAVAATADKKHTTKKVKKKQKSKKAKKTAAEAKEAAVEVKEAAAEGKWVQEQKASKKKASKMASKMSIEERLDFDQRVLEAVAGGASKVGAVREVVGGERMDALAVLNRLSEAGRLVKQGEGRRARYFPEGTEVEDKAVAEDTAKKNAPEVREVKPRKKRLRWRSTVDRGRTLQSATYSGGKFWITPMLSGRHSLHFETGDSIFAYGCGTEAELQKTAQELANRGLPTPELFRAHGGEVNACPPPRRMRVGDVELVWRETVKDGRQICLAATGDGEMRVIESEGGSFVLAYVRAGDASFERLGCGTREELEVRALRLLEELSPDLPEEAPDTEAEELAAAPTSAAESEPTGVEIEDSAEDQRKTEALMRSLAVALQQTDLM